MGQIHDLRCSKCGYEIDALLGIGMMYSKSNIFEGEKPMLTELVSDTEIINRALKAVAAGEKISDDYGYSTIHFFP